MLRRFAISFLLVLLVWLRSALGKDAAALRRHAARRDLRATRGRRPDGLARRLVLDGLTALDANGLREPGARRRMAIGRQRSSLAVSSAPGRAFSRWLAAECSGRGHGAEHCRARQIARGPRCAPWAPRWSLPATRRCPTCPRCSPAMRISSRSRAPPTGKLRRTPSAPGRFSSRASNNGVAHAHRQRQLLAGPAVPRRDCDCGQPADSRPMARPERGPRRYCRSSAAGAAPGATAAAHGGGFAAGRAAGARKFRTRARWRMLCCARRLRRPSIAARSST